MPRQLAVADPSSLGWSDHIWSVFTGSPATPHSKILGQSVEDDAVEFIDHASVLTNREGLLWTIEIFMG